MDPFECYRCQNNRHVDCGPLNKRRSVSEDYPLDHSTSLPLQFCFNCVGLSGRFLAMCLSTFLPFVYLCKLNQPTSLEVGISSRSSVCVSVCMHVCVCVHACVCVCVREREIQMVYFSYVLHPWGGGGGGGDKNLSEVHTNPI